METFKILSVKEEDLEMCLDTIHKAFGANCERFGFTKENYPSGGAFLTLDVLKKQKTQGVHMYAAWVGGKIIGYVQLEKKENGVYSFQKFAVLPGYQNIGIGKALISFCKNKAKIYGGEKIKLLFVYNNEKLRNFYLDNGFKIISTSTDDDHPFLCGNMEMEL